MKDLIDKINSLERVSSILEPNEENRNNLIQQVTNYAHEFINSLDQNPVFYPEQPNTEEFEISDKRMSFPKIIEFYKNQIVKKGINAASGRHLGYIPGGGLFTASLADMMVDISNEYAGMYFASPGAVTVENELINWLKKIYAYPDSAIGNLTSGGSIANLIAITSARDRFKVKGDKIERSVVYMSPQAHHCMDKALRIIGLEDIIIRRIKLDAFSRIDADDLRLKIQIDKKNNLLPFMVIASAGTTDTGAVDPLDKIGQIANQEACWYHIDAAYGGFFILTESKKTLFKGIERSDSLVVDPHKGLFLPYGIGAVLIKDKQAVYQSHRITANYMQDALEDETPVNPADVSPELTRHFRGMRMWLPLQLHGIKPFAACLEEKIHLLTYTRKRLTQLGFSLGPEPDLSVTYFWYPSKETDTTIFNKKLMEFMQQDGSSFFSSTKINGHFVIRVAILSFRTKLYSIDKALSMISDCLIKTHEYFEKDYQ